MTVRAAVSLHVDSETNVDIVATNHTRDGWIALRFDCDHYIYLTPEQAQRVMDALQAVIPAEVEA